MPEVIDLLMSTWIVKTPPTEGESFFYRHYNEDHMQPGNPSTSFLLTLLLLFCESFLHNLDQRFTADNVRQQRIADDKREHKKHA